MPYKDPQKRKDYSKAYNKEWYEKTKEKRLKQIYARKKKNKLWYKAYKENLSCTVCGFDKEPKAIDFHHVNGSTKEITPSRMIRQGYSIERMKTELAKCIPLCANCHRVFHLSTRR